MTRYYVRKSIRKWAFLEPWCAFLREHVSLQLVTDHKDDLLLCVRLRPEAREPLAAFRERVVHLREALELLTVIAYVDTLAWQDLLRFKCACVRSPFWDDWRLPLGLWLKLGDAKNAELEAFDTALYRAFFTAFASDAQAMRPTARMAMQGILSEMTPAMHRAVAAHRRVDVCLRFVPPHSLAAERVVEYLRDVIQTVNDCIAVAKAHSSATAAGDGDADLGRRYMTKLALNDVELHIGEMALPPGAPVLLAAFVALETQTVGFYPLLDVGAHTPLGRLPLTDLAPLLEAIAARVSSTNRRLSRGEVVSSPPPEESFALIGNASLGSAPLASLAYARRFRAVVSALGVSQCFDQLSLDHVVGANSDGTRAKQWQWLAYALWSKASRARVSKLSLSELPITQADISAIVSVLNARDPARKLAGLCRTTRDVERLATRAPEGQMLPTGDFESAEGTDDGDERAVAESDDDPDVRRFYSRESAVSGAANADEPSCCSSVVVRKGATVAIDPWNRESELNQRESFVLPCERAFDVVHDDPQTDRVGVLVPCYGFCTVARDAVVRRVTSANDSSAETSFARGYRGSIRSLHLAPGAGTAVAVMLPLLKYLGSKLLALELSHQLDIDAERLRLILDACPHLRALRVIGPSSGIEDELIAAYAQSRCAVSDLRLEDFRPTDATLRLLRALRDNTTQVAQTITTLTLSPESGTLDAATLAALLDMLASNAQLELLRLELAPELMKEFKPLVMKHHGDVIAGECAPLALECRLAFLSVARFIDARDEDASDDEALPRKRRRRDAAVARAGQLDRGVASLIFQFAAERRTRRIRVCEAEA